MNIIIYGGMMSGKTLLANLMAEYYQKQGQKVEIIGETTEISTSRKQFAELNKKAESILELTKGNEKNHTIVTTQATPMQIYRFFNDFEKPSLYDYAYHALKIDKLPKY